MFVFSSLLSNDWHVRVRVQVTGKWIFAVGISDSEERSKELKEVNNSWIEITSVPDRNEMSLHWGDKM